MKKFIKVAFVAAIAAVAGYGVYENQKTDVMSDLALANVEALANDTEVGGSCTASVSCSNNPNDFVRCTGTHSCEREAGLFGRWVKCDGKKSSC